jgi:phytoene dehydrogenase-like protein
MGIALASSAHVAGWPVPRGGSQAIVDALAAHLGELGVEIETSRPVRSLEDVPESTAVLFDVTPRQLLDICGDALPPGYRRRLGRFRYGPGVFKVDYALSGPVPWTNDECRQAGALHLGGTLAEIAAAEADVARGRHPERPFVLVGQQSLADPTRAPAGQHTLWTYCHVPNGSDVDMTDAIERQIERFAPGFGDIVLARHSAGSAWYEGYNPNFVGGDIAGGSHGGLQLVARPRPGLRPYATPNPRLFLCSASTPPGGGVHGMCGMHAAQSALRSTLR